MQRFQRPLPLSMQGVTTRQTTGGGRVPVRRARELRRTCSSDHQGARRPREAEKAGDGGRGEGADGPKPRTECCSLPWESFVEKGARFFHEVGFDPSLLIGVADDEAVIAQDIHQARDPAGVIRDPLDRAGGEDPEIARAGDAEPEIDVLAGLLRRERTDAEPQGDPLLELPHLRQPKLGPELGLPDQQNLEELRGGRFEVREQPNLFERLQREVLRLVEDQDRSLAGPMALDQEVVEGDEALGLRLSGLGDAEVLEDVFEQSVEGQRRVEDERRGGGAIEPAEEGSEQGRLARTHLSGQQNEPDFVLDSVRELRQGVAMPARQIEKFRIGRCTEGLLAESVEVEVHRRVYELPRESSQTSCSLPCATK